MTTFSIPDDRTFATIAACSSPSSRRADHPHHARHSHPWSFVARVLWTYGSSAHLRTTSRTSTAPATRAVHSRPPREASASRNIAHESFALCTPHFAAFAAAARTIERRVIRSVLRSSRPYSCLACPAQGQPQERRRRNQSRGTNGLHERGCSSGVASVVKLGRTTQACIIVR